MDSRQERSRGRRSRAPTSRKAGKIVALNSLVDPYLYCDTRSQKKIVCVNFIAVVFIAFGCMCQEELVH